MNSKKPRKKTLKKEAPKPLCGIVMPISAIGECSESHWSDVRDIVSDSIDAAGFDPHLVSDADDVGIIQKRIIQNLYDNPIIVCDVSEKNPNVMFELGLRLAFDKPTVIIKDDKTTYSFDTAPIEHLDYPRDLRFTQIVEFKEELTEKLKGTHKKAVEDSSYTPFLKHFGKFTVAKLDTKQVTPDEFILDELRSIRKAITGIEGSSQAGFARSIGKKLSIHTICLHNSSPEGVEEIRKKLAKHATFAVTQLGPKHFHLHPLDTRVEVGKILSVVRQMNPTARLLPTRA